MKSIRIVFFLVCSLFICGASGAFAQTVYVTDEFEIMLRTGPSIENKIIAMLPTGTRLEMIEEKDDWAFVRDSNDREGWIFKRYASTQIPKKILIERLQKEYSGVLKNLETQTQKGRGLEKENKELRVALNTTQEQLEKVKKDYDSLASGSKDFIKLRDEHAANLAGLRAAEAELTQLKKENEELRFSRTIIWFLSGAGVVVVSWLIGFMMGKIRRKSRSHLLYG